MSDTPPPPPPPPPAEPPPPPPPAPPDPALAVATPSGGRGKLVAILIGIVVLVGGGLALATASGGDDADDEGETVDQGAGDAGATDGAGPISGGFLAREPGFQLIFAVLEDGADTIHRAFLICGSDVDYQSYRTIEEEVGTIGDTDLARGRPTVVGVDVPLDGGRFSFESPDVTVDGEFSEPDTVEGTITPISDGAEDCGVPQPSASWAATCAFDASIDGDFLALTTATSGPCAPGAAEPDPDATPAEVACDLLEPEEIVDALGIYVDTAKPDSADTCSYTGSGGSFSDVAAVTADLETLDGLALLEVAQRRVQTYSQPGQPENVEFAPLSGLGDEALAYDSGDGLNYVIAVRVGDRAFVLTVLDVFSEASTPLPEAARTLAELALARM